jgi:hypothetical protein
MTQSIDYSQWQSCEHDDEPQDQQRDLFSGYWAEVGPDPRRNPGGWSWTILQGGDGDDVDGGFADDETSAKAAVQKWADEHDKVTVYWEEVVARSATFTRDQLAHVEIDQVPVDVEPGNPLAVLLSGAAADMDSDLGTVRVTITSIDEED